MNFLTLAAEGGGLVEQELAFIALLSIAALVAIVVARIRVPFTIALVLVGLVLSFVPDFINIDISSDLILFLLVPPLIFEAALHLPWPKLKADLGVILLVALVGTLISSMLVAWVVSSVLGVNLAAAIAFGALISATDPVAVIAFFKTLGVDKRLAILVEGESLFNDGVAIVIFNLAVAAGAAIAAGTYEGFSLANAVGEIIVVAGGGIVIGSILGGVVSYIILKNVDDPLIETAVTVTLAFGSFVVAERFGAIFGFDDSFHLSGILAVVAASLFVGNIGTLNTSPSTKVVLNSFWEFLTFVVNSLVFLIIGIRIDITSFREHWAATLLAIGLVLIVRMLVIYSLTWVHARIQPKRNVPVAYRHIMFWGGLRGAISLALALTFSVEVFGEETVNQLQVMTFGVVLFTLLIQGLTIENIIGRLGVAKRKTEVIEQEQRQAQVFAQRAGREELERLRQQGILSGDIWRSMATVYDREIELAQTNLREHLNTYPELEQNMILQARYDVLQAERGAILDAARRGLISTEVSEHLVEEIDNRFAALDVIESKIGK